MTISYRLGQLGEQLDGRRLASEERISQLSAQDLAARSAQDIVEEEMHSILFEPLEFDFDRLSYLGDPVQREFGVPHEWAFLA